MRCWFGWRREGGEFTMRDNRRRNRNIGTVKQGHGQNNHLCIPGHWSTDDYRNFTERLTQYKKIARIINEHEFTFVVEDTRTDCSHACTVEDVVFMLSHIPAADYGNLRLIIFRQPKRKEEILSPVWGRLRYFYHFEGVEQPAVVLEAVPNKSHLKYSKGMPLDVRNEFDRLKKDGHVFIADKRGYTSKLTQETVRATQLYRTLLHEFGHYVEYRQFVENPGSEFSDMDEVARSSYYFDSIPSAEKEKFAHAYADRLRDALLLKGIIPFSRRH